MTSLSDLIERVEAATGPDRGLDAEILWHIRPDRFAQLYWAASLGRPQPLETMPRSGMGWVSVTRFAPLYTKSLDDVRTLIDPADEWEVSTIYNIARAGVGLNRDHQTSWPGHGENAAADPVLALLAAALKARALQEKDIEHG